MSFVQAEQSATEFRRLFEEVYISLAAIEFNPEWVDNQGHYTRAVHLATPSDPVCSVDRTTNRRMVLLPTHRFGTVVIYDMWPNRGETSPMAAAHPEGLDLVNLPFAMMARSADAVASQYAQLGRVTWGEAALSPIFAQLLNEAAECEGALVKFS